MEKFVHFFFSEFGGEFTLILIEIFFGLRGFTAIEIKLISYHDCCFEGQQEVKWGDKSIFSRMEILTFEMKLEYFG